MSGRIRLGCGSCDRDDIRKIPSDWVDVTVVQTLKSSRQEVENADQSRSPFEWYTHLGTCPDCQAADA